MNKKDVPDYEQTLIAWIEANLVLCLRDAYHEGDRERVWKIAGLLAGPKPEPEKAT